MNYLNCHLTKLPNIVKLSTVCTIRSFVQRRRCFTEPKILAKCSIIRSYATTIDVNLNLAKDVLLYRYENARFFKMLLFGATSQYVFWSYVSYLCFAELRDAPVDRSAVTADDPWYMRVNLGDNFLKNMMGTLCLVLGWGLFFIGVLYTMRSVRYLVLHKGGLDVSIVTYTPLGKNRIIKVPVKEVCCFKSRKSATEGSTMPLKVKGKWFFFLIDSRGEFRNAILFDNTVGMFRKFNK